MYKTVQRVEVQEHRLRVLYTCLDLNTPNAAFLVTERGALANWPNQRKKEKGKNSG